MSLSIKEKLRFLDRSVGSQLTAEPNQPTRAPDPLKLADSRLVDNEYGTCLVREKQFPLSFIHGNTRLREFMDVPSKLFAFIGNDLSFGHLNQKDLLFLDTETTGLAGGTGTLIFLIGMGYFEDDTFCVKQFVLLNPRDEGAFLFEIEKCLASKSCFITFNGKSYDVPLLNTRFILNKIRCSTEQFSHIDLLHHSRRLWKKTIASCSLSNIEAQILGFQRQHDIPGSQIPQTYFQFLRSQNIDALVPILKHNVQDILSLVAIILQSLPIFRGESTSADMSWVMRILFNLNHYKEAMRVKSPLELSNRNDEYQNFLLEKAKVNRRLGYYPKALEIWEEIQGQVCFNESSYVEAAKVLEHQLRDYKRAIDILVKMEKRLNILRELRPHQRLELRDDLTKRKQRVLEKLAKAEAIV